VRRRQRVGNGLFQQVAQQALALGAQHVQRVGGHRWVDGDK
jgi:hypothetical protein